MLQTSGANNLTTPIKNISAAKPSRGSGQTRAKNRRGGENVRWKRLTASFDAALAELGRVSPNNIDKAISVMAGNSRLYSVVTRLVFFKHLTVTQGMAARRYADVMARFERYHVDAAQRSARAQNYEPARPGADDEIQRHLVRGTIHEYETEAKKARKDYQRAMKVLDRYADVTGRNQAKNVLDDVCLADLEPPAQYRPNLAAVLQALADAFGIKEKR